MKRNSVFTLVLTASLALTSSICTLAEDKNGDSTPDPDNTEVNQRDRSGDTQTSGDQSNSSEDIQVTAAIRRAIIADDSLTTTASNIKIVTANGTVTLRGPVKTSEEKAKIAQIARREAGSMKIDDQLEVENSNK